MKVEWSNVREIVIGVALAMIIVEGIKAGVKSLSKPGGENNSSSENKEEKNK